MVCPQAPYLRDSLVTRNSRTVFSRVYGSLLVGLAALGGVLPLPRRSPAPTKFLTQNISFKREENVQEAEVTDGFHQTRREE